MSSPRQFKINDVDGYQYKQSSPRCAATPTAPTTTAQAGVGLRRSTITFYAGLHKAAVALDHAQDEDLSDKPTISDVKP